MRALVVTVALTLAGCNSYYIYPCTDDASCDVSGAGGRCLPGGGGASFCAFATANFLCPSRLVWDSSAPPPLAGNCVVLPDGD